MHPESMNEMKAFADKYVKPGAPVLDVGSLDINGSYRGLFPEGMYQGLDLIPGPNVDVVAEPYHWPLEDEHYGAVISGQAFEHIEHPDQTMKEINRVLAPGGFVCIIAPSTGPTHEYPIDYRRYNVAGLKKLAKDGGLKVISAVIYKSEPWNDAVLIAQKSK